MPFGDCKADLHTGPERSLSLEKPPFYNRRRNRRQKEAL
jgi:hypothetical protein